MMSENCVNDLVMVNGVDTPLVWGSYLRAVMFRNVIRCSLDNLVSSTNLKSRTSSFTGTVPTSLSTMLILTY
jgi:hypothetical protein